MELLRKLSKTCGFRRVIVYFLTYCMIFHVSLPVALAGPEGAQVVNGQVSIQQSGNNTTITASDKSIINYSGFDIAQPEVVRFVQPGSSASVLNRILSANPTSIYGTLLANGRVFFVNPAGVYIGSGATINVNQLVASALDISNADFVNGRYNFVGGDGSVINSGDISAESVYLIGKQVANSGSISCPAGYVIMAAGDRVFLGEPGSDVVVEIDPPVSSEPADPIDTAPAVLNEGTVDCGGGMIVLAAAGDIYSQAISNVGTLSASVDAGQAGEVKLVADEGTVLNSGTIEATSNNGKGGTVEVLGDRVALVDAAEIDVSGSDGGGTVLVGGDYQGSGDVPTASRTYVSADSTIKADATDNGDGGKVIVWADEITGFYGNISARGGAEAGDGGFAEVSGKGNLVFEGKADLRAGSGETGTLLLDPTNITISNDTDTGTMTWDGTRFTDVTISPSNLNVSTLENELASSNVEVATTPGVANGDTGWIWVQDEIGAAGAWSSEYSLTLTADDYIQIDAPITNGGSGGLTLSAGSAVALDGAISLNGGNFTSSGTDFTSSATGSIATDGGNVDLNHAGNVSISGAIATGGGHFTSSGTNFDTSSTGTIATDGGTVGLNHTGNVAIAGAVATGGGHFSSSGTNFDNFAEINTAGGNVNLDGQTGDIGIGDNIIAGSGDITATGATSLSIAATASGITCDNFTTGTSGTFTAASESVVNASSVDGGDIVINAGSDVTLGGTAGGQLINTGSNNISIDGGAISLGEDSINIADGTLTIQGGSINASGPGTAAEIEADGDVSLTGGEIGGNRRIDITGDTVGDSTLSINSNSDGDVDVEIADDQFSNVDITIAGVTDDTFDIVWTAGTDQIKMATDMTALTITTVDTSQFGSHVLIWQQVGDVFVGSVDTGTADFALTASTGAIRDDIDDSGAPEVDIEASVIHLTAIGGGIGMELETSPGTMWEDRVLEVTATAALNADTDDWDILIYSMGNLPIGLVDAGSGTVTLNSSGAITESGSDPESDISGGMLSLTADNGIAGGSAIETHSRNITASTDQGDIDIDNDREFATTASLSVDSGAGNILFSQAGGGDLEVVLASTANGNIDIDATANVTLGSLTALGNQITIASDGAIRDAADDDSYAPEVDIEASTITLDASLGGIGTAGRVLEVTATAALNADTDAGDDGDILIDSMGNLPIGLVDAGGGTVALSSSGAISESGNDPESDITAGILLLTADNGIAGGSAIETSSTNITASTDQGDIDIENDIASATTASLSVTSGQGNIFFNQVGGGSLEVTTATTTDGSIGLDVSGTNANLKVADVTAGGTGNIALEATEGAITQDSGTITANGDSLTMKSNDDLRMANYNVANPGSTDLILDSTGGSAIVMGSAADNWKSITAAAQYNVVLSGDGDITTGNLESRYTGVSTGVQIFTDTGSGGGLDAQGTINSGGFVTVDVEGTASFADTLTAGGNIEVESTGGAVTAAGDISASNGGVTIDAVGDITTNTIAPTNTNIEIRSTGGDLIINSELAAGGGVSLIADSGTIYTPGSVIEIEPGVWVDALNVAITGYSDGTKGVPLPFGPGVAAIVISSKENLLLGQNATLIANGTYRTTVDDLAGVAFSGGDPIDVAIYLGSLKVTPEINVDVRSQVAAIGDYGAMVIDGHEAVTFQGSGSLFETSTAFDMTNWLEVVSRVTRTMGEAVNPGGTPSPRLPYGEDPHAIALVGGGWFRGTYVLRGDRPLAKVLAMEESVPLVTPKPFEPEIVTEVETPDEGEMMAWLAAEFNEPDIQTYLADAYPSLFSTDLRPYKAAERLREFSGTLKDSAQIAALRTVVSEVWPADQPPDDLGMALIAQRFAVHADDGTHYALAGEWMNALTEYVSILSTEIGWSTEESVTRFFRNYGPKLEEGGDIKTSMFVQMHLERTFGT